MEKKESGSYYFKIVIVQFVFAITVVLIVIGVKLFSKDTYKQLKEWYNENIAVDTDVYEVLGEINEI